MSSQSYRRNQNSKMISVSRIATKLKHLKLFHLTLPPNIPNLTNIYIYLYVYICIYLFVHIYFFIDK